MACQTEMPVATRDPPSCQLERAIWFTAQKDMKLFWMVSLVMVDTMHQYDLRPSSPGSPMRWQRPDVVVDPHVGDIVFARGDLQTSCQSTEGHRIDCKTKVHLLSIVPLLGMRGALLLYASIRTLR
jgi:hypothetical protein